MVVDRPLRFLAMRELWGTLQLSGMVSGIRQNKLLGVGALLILLLRAGLERRLTSTPRREFLRAYVRQNVPNKEAL